MSTPATNQLIRDILGAHARLPVEVSTLADSDDLYEAGMTSHASVEVMLALEDGFDVEFPDAMLKRSIFASVINIAAAIGQLDRAAAA
ncbi:acyl carrier protein [Sphingomonas sp. F9_3S_D5_B_2]